MTDPFHSGLLAREPLSNGSRASSTAGSSASSPATICPFCTGILSFVGGTAPPCRRTVRPRSFPGSRDGRVAAVRHQVFKLPSGLCACVVGDPVAGSRRIEVLKISGTEVVLEPDAGLEPEQFIYSTVELDDGPSMSLAGFVISVGGKGTVVQWNHASPKDADRIGKVLAEYARTHAPKDPDCEDAALGAGEPSSEESSHGSAESDEAASERSSASAEDSRRGDRSAKPKPADSEASRATPPREPSRRRMVVGDPVKLNQSARREGSQRAPRSTDSKPIPPRESSPTRERSPSAQVEPSAEPAAKKPSVVRVGDRLDVAASIRNRAKAVRASDLASRVDTVHVLNLGTIKELIKAAVDEAVVMLGPTLGELERRKLLDEAEEGFREQVRAFQAEKEGLAAQTQNLESQLEKARALLEEERQRVVSANQFTVSDQSMVEIETRFHRLLERAVHSGSVSDDLEQDLRGVIGRLLDDERDKIRAQAERAQNDKIELLEKKIARLAENLDTTAKERDRARLHAQALEAAGILPRGNVLLPGLAADDPDRTRKLDLLKEIVSINREIRKSIARERGEELPETPEDEMPEAASEATFESDEPAPGLHSSDEEREESTRADPPESVDEEPESPPVSSSDDDLSRELVGEGDDLDDDEERIPVLADGGGDEIDPDDLPWEPKGGTSVGTVEIRRLG